MDREPTPPTTKAAFPTWDGRIAPLFDTARALHLVVVADARVVSGSDELLPLGPAERRAARLAALGVETLVCGAISRESRAAVEAAGVRVVPFVAGERREVVRAFVEGALEGPEFAMPGCGGGRRRRFRGGSGRGGGGRCLCPACGHAVPHAQGIPCVEVRCPECGAAMARES
jgi:predicted Fe-Mo cluster-binding NifX family protein